jgi:transcriptional regulator with XRE-family HTH domain
MDLRETREAANINQAELAARTRIPQSNISYCESGTRPLTVPDMLKIEQILGSIDWPDPVPPKSKAAVLNSLHVMASRFPLEAALRFCLQILTDRHEEAPVRKIVAYGKAAVGYGEILYPPDVPGVREE